MRCANTPDMVKSRLLLSLLGTLLAPVLSTAVSSDARATPVDGTFAVRRAPVLMEERLHNLRRRESPVIEDETAATIDFAEVIRSVDALFRDPAAPGENSKEETEAVTTAGRITAELLDNPPQETDRFPLAQPPEEPEDKWIRMAREGYRKKDLELLMAAAEIVGLQGLLEAEVLRIRERMPAPLGLGSERHAARIQFGEGLESGHVGREGKAPVSDRKRSEGVNRRHMGIVALHQCRPVDPVAAGYCRKSNRRKE